MIKVSYRAWAGTDLHSPEPPSLTLDISLALPPLAANDIERFLRLQSITGENSLVKQFRQWLSPQIV